MRSKRVEPGVARPVRKTFLASYLPALRRDIQEVVAWSEDKFGASTADRYALLIRQALRDVLEEPTRPGAKARPDLAPHAYVYHLMFSRERVAGERVKAPRHFVLYRHMDEQVEFARLLHDSRDLVRHLPPTLQNQ
jgi:toxin ParE1/3/4